MKDEQKMISKIRGARQKLVVLLIVFPVCYQASECQEFLLSERTTFLHNTGIVQETGSQAHKGKPLPSDVSDEFLKKASQVCLFSAL